MPKRSRKRLPDPAELAFAVVQSLDPPEQAPAPPADGKDPLAVELGRRGGLKGGPARKKALTKAQRVASAKKAAAARWGKKR
jgi:hypothetical protein